MVALRRLALLPAAALAVALLPAPSAADPASDAVVAEVNAARAAAGAPPVEPSDALMRSSRRWARRLARKGVLRHSRLREHRRDFRRVAEAIEMQPRRGRGAARAAVGAWLASPAHRAILLDPELSRIGVGHAAGRRRSTYWVARLGEPG